MTGDSILIAAFSGRALAASARRAGFLPLVVDCFGDEDTVAAAADLRCLPARVQTGFRLKPLIAALNDLTSSVASPPIGLVLGGGFECNPRLVATIAQHFELIGNSAEAIRRTKDPATFFDLLGRLGIPHPETRLSSPERSEGWLMKRRGGSGGLHIIPCPEGPRPDSRRYFQRRLEGTPISILAVAAPGELSVVGFSRQWCSPLARRPFRYGGAAGPLVAGADLDRSLAATMVAAAERLAPELGLAGLISFDFLVTDGVPNLLEVNPRPSATLDVFDDAKGTLFAAHLAACRGLAIPESARSDGVRAAALLYADGGPITIRSVDWPSWSADRPRSGAMIPARAPLATARAESDTAEAAERACRHRLMMLQQMLYVRHPGNGAPQ